MTECFRCLKPDRRIFVCGPNADSQTILGDWAVPQVDDDVITALEGIRAEFPEQRSTPCASAE